MSAYKKAWKLNESLAHSPGIVTTLSFGKRSGRVMATGGDDKEVKLWAVGKSSCILRFRGQSSTPESTEFNAQEDHVAAGSLSGSIKIWNLDNTTLIRSLSGHSSAVRSLHFHQYGNYIVSGSLDTSIKIWDISKKGCINTYRGHTNCVNEVKFSPDGKWLVSASDDCTVKLWCLTTGKLLADLADHNGPITSIAFHPTNLLLATASLDKTVRIYDLETFSVCAMSGIELGATPVRKLIFHPDGSCLYCATQDFLKIYNYETMECLETLSVGWRAGGGIVDMAVVPSFNQIVASCLTQSYVSTYVVDAKSCLPFTYEDDDFDEYIMAEDHIEPQEIMQRSNNTTFIKPVYQRPNNLNAGKRKSFCLSGEENKRTVFREDPNLSHSEDTECESFYSSPVIDDRDEYNRVFNPRRRLDRSPIRYQQNSDEHTPTGPEAAPQITSPAPMTPRQQNSSCNSNLAKKKERPPVRNNVNEIQNENMPKVYLENNNNNGSIFQPTQISVTQSQPPVQNNNNSDCRPPWNPFFATETDPNSVLSGKGDPLGGDNIIDLPTEMNASIMEKNDIEHLRRIHGSHENFMTVIEGRRQCLESIKAQWTNNSPLKAIESTVAIKDAAVLVDMLTILNQNTKCWNLDMAKTLLPSLTTLIKSKYNTHVEATCQSLKIVLRHFSSLIMSTAKGQHPHIGVDLYQEQRVQKCRDCLSFLETIRLLLESPDIQEKAGPLGKETRVLFTMLD